MAKSKTAEVVNTLIENFDYDKFVKEHKEEMNEMYRVPFGGSYVMGDTELTNAKYIQKRAKWIRSDSEAFSTRFWVGDIVRLINRILAGNPKNELDLTEEKRQQLVVESLIG